MTKVLLLSVVVSALGLPCFGNSVYVGSDTACFYGFSASPCTPVNTETGIGSNLAGNPVLLYTPDSSFNAPAGGGMVELGNFYVTPSLLGGDGGNFTLDISFTDPTDGTQTFTATTLGLVVLGQLGAEVTFSQPLTQAFDYAGGSFDVTLPKTVLIGSGDTVPLDATITTIAAAPEPASVASVLGGLMLLGIVAVRDRKNRIRRMFARSIPS